VVHVGEGKGGAALRDFWKRLLSSGAKVEAVAADMSPAYIEAVREHLPQATLVFDRFHVMKLFNDKLSDLRRESYREATDMQHKQVLKGTRSPVAQAPGELGPEARRIGACLGVRWGEHARRGRRPWLAVADVRGNMELQNTHRVRDELPDQSLDDFSRRSHARDALWLHNESLRCRRSTSRL
jgi:hypothetical protein